MHFKRFLSLGLLATLLALAACSSAATPQPTTSPTRPPATATAAEPTATADLGGVPMGFTEDGALTLLEFSEYL
jgi:hypothetical protein